MPDLRLSNGWDRTVEAGLPDCRLRYGNREQVMRGPIAMETVYCANCGEKHGLATVWTPYVFFICDGCFSKTGRKAPEGTIELRMEASR